MALSVDLKETEAEGDAELGPLILTGQNWGSERASCNPGDFFYALTISDDDAPLCYISLCDTYIYITERGPVRACPLARLTGTHSSQRINATRFESSNGI